MSRCAEKRKNHRVAELGASAHLAGVNYFSEKGLDFKPGKGYIVFDVFGREPFILEVQK